MREVGCASVCSVGWHESGGQVAAMWHVSCDLSAATCATAKLWSAASWHTRMSKYGIISTMLTWQASEARRAAAYMPHTHMCARPADVDVGKDDDEAASHSYSKRGPSFDDNESRKEQVFKT